jgi:hypothetical protein
MAMGITALWPVRDAGQDVPGGDPSGMGEIAGATGAVAALIGSAKPDSYPVTR